MDKIPAQGLKASQLMIVRKKKKNKTEHKK